MKSRFRFIFVFLSVLAVSSTAYADTPHINLNRTRQRAKESLLYCRTHGYNTSYCMLIDMTLPSGVKRFVVWDFRKNDTVFTGLVSHGCGINPWSGIWSKDKPAFSNVANSHCTSLGKYQVSSRAYSAWGIHIKYYLNGLEGTNSNALKRDVVLHSWEQVADNEIYPNGTPEDWGCPVISNNTMKLVDALIHDQKMHLLLWIYN